MNRISKVCLFLASLFIFISCHYKREKAQPDLWFPLDFETNTPIRNMFAGPAELNLITDDEFMRIGIDGEVIERRSIDLPLNFFGRPSVSRYSFVRLVRAQQVDNGVIVQKKLMELHLVKDPNQVFKFDIESLVEGEESLTLEEFSRYGGAYNDEETKYLFITLNNTLDKHSLFLMNLNINAQKTQILDVSLDKRIDIELKSDNRLVSNIKFLNGFFYLTSEFGAWRIDPINGTAVKLFNSWIKDAFQYNDRIYLTGFNDFDFYVSSDNGETFGPAGMASTLKFVEVENEQVFSQNQLGLPWELAEEDLFSSNPVTINADFIDDGALFWNIKYFYNRHYISAQKQLFYTDDLQVE